MNNHENFEAVCDRLMRATGLPTETALAEALGFKPSAFSNRKKRGALPIEEVEELAQQRQLNKDWVLSGEGAMYEGGEVQTQREKDFRELVAQITAMTLHNETRRLVTPLLKGVVWGDSTSVEKWVHDVSGLSAEERVILQAYRTGGAEIKGAMDLIAQRAPMPTRSGAKMRFHGPVTQAVGGDLITQTNTLNNAESVPAAQRKPRK